MKRAHLELPYLARESELWTLDLPAKRKVEYMRCHNRKISFLAFSPQQSLPSLTPIFIASQPTITNSSVPKTLACSSPTTANPS